MVTINLRAYEIVLKALANKRRFAIVEFLKKNGEATVGEIAETIKLSFTSTSKHLLILDKADILIKDQRNKEVYYMVASDTSRLAKQILSEL